MGAAERWSNGEPVLNGGDLSDSDVVGYLNEYNNYKCECIALNNALDSLRQPGISLNVL